MEALQFVRIGLQVVELYVPVLVLDVLVGLGPDRLVGELTVGPSLGYPARIGLGFVLGFVLGFILGLVFVPVFAFALNFFFLAAVFFDGKGGR